MIWHILDFTCIVLHRIRMFMGICLIGYLNHYSNLRCNFNLFKFILKNGRDFEKALKMCWTPRLYRPPVERNGAFNFPIFEIKSFNYLCDSKGNRDWDSTRKPYTWPFCGRHVYVYMWKIAIALVIESTKIFSMYFFVSLSISLSLFPKKPGVNVDIWTYIK